MTEVVKTAKLRLHEPTERKRERIRETMETCQTIKEEVAIKVPSVQKDLWSRKKADVWERWRKELYRKHDLNSMIVEQCVQKVRQTFASWQSNGYKGKRPQLKGKETSEIRYRKTPKFFRKNGAYYVNLPFKAGRANNRDVFPLLPSPYVGQYLPKIVDGDLRCTYGVLKRMDGRFFFNMTVRKEVDLSYTPKTFIGVDPGLNVLAWAVAVDEEGSFVAQKHKRLGGGTLVDRMHEIGERRSKLQHSGLRKRKVKGSREKEHVKNEFIETATRRIPDFAKVKQLERPMILVEYTNIQKMRRETSNPDIHSWPVGQFRDKLITKALWEGIQCLPINGAYTSQTCPECGHTDEDNRHGIYFECVNCGYENHSDFVGALGLARRGIKLQPYAKAIFSLDSILRKRLMKKYTTNEVVGITKEQLQEVKGIGEKTAKRFISMVD